MKKLFLIAVACILIAGCGKTKEEKEEILYDSLEKAYVAVFSAEGAGLPVFEEQKIEIDGETWYKVALSEYANIEKLLAYAEDVYSKDISEELSEKLTTKYRQSNGDLYTPSKGQCTLDYFLTEKGIKSKQKITTSGYEQKLYLI